MSQGENLIELLINHSIKYKDKVLYEFIDFQKNTNPSLTFSDLDIRAKAIAAKLQSKFGNKTKGLRVLLMFDPGLEFIEAFLGCLYAGMISIPAYPPEPGRLNKSLPRLKAIYKDANPSIVLTNKRLYPQIRLFFFRMPKLFFGKWLVIEAIEKENHYRWIKPNINEDDIAFLQYTSGSTSEPKGVMVTHRNIIENSRLISFSAESDEKSILLSWLPTFHDMGLMNGVIQPIYVGCLSILMSPLDFLRKPETWLKAISKYHVTHTGGPNFAFDLCLKKIDEKRLRDINLGSLKVAYCGAEPVRTDTLDAFYKKFKKYGFKKEAFYPCYGLAEATVKVTGGIKKEGFVSIKVDSEKLKSNLIEESENGIEFCGSGKALLSSQLLIVDPESKVPVKENCIGEIWVSGPSVTKGYWNKPELTKENFNAYTSNTNQGPYLRTGDLGFLKNGELFITGRLKDMLIINGQNIFPEDLEWTLSKHIPEISISSIGIFSIRGENQKESAVVVAGIKPKHYLEKNLKKIKEKIYDLISIHHGVTLKDVLLTQSKSIPKTSSGKIQRHQCKTMYLNKSFERFDKQNSPYKIFNLQKLENRNDLTEITTMRLQDWFIHKVAKELNIPEDKIDVHKPLSTYLDSISMIGLINDFSKKVNSKFDVSNMTSDNSIFNLTKELSKNEAHQKNNRNTSRYEHLKNINPVDKKIEVKNIFLTGCTGVLGAYLLKELILNPSIKTIYCLIRASNYDHANQRIKQALSVYAEDSNLKNYTKIIPIIGDISSPHFNLSPEEYLSLINKTDAVLHTASSTNLFLSYELLKLTNVIGTQHILEFTLKTKNNYLMYISSYSVMGDLIKKRRFVFKEKDFDLGQKFNKMGYQETKFEAEALVRKASLEKGLMFNIFRPGNIFGDSKNGSYPFEIESVSHLYYEILDMIIKTKVAARAKMIFDVSPVDYVARGILYLGLKCEKLNSTYHLLNPDIKSWNEIAKLIIDQGQKIKLMSLAKYLKKIESGDFENIDTKFNKIIALMRFGFADYDYFNSSAYCSSTHTNQLLEKENIHCPRIDQTLIRHYLETYTSNKLEVIDKASK